LTAVVCVVDGSRDLEEVLQLVDVVQIYRILLRRRNFAWKLCRRRLLATLSGGASDEVVVLTIYDLVRGVVIEARAALVLEVVHGYDGGQWIVELVQSG